MYNKVGSFFKVSSLVLSLAFVFSACGGDIPFTSVTPAEQLAADINAISAGKASVNDTTIILLGEIVIINGLTVPEGVNLDITRDEARLILKNSILTVNGTINARSQKICLDDFANFATINGSGTIYLNGTGILLRITGNTNIANQKITIDGVVLAGVDNNIRPFVVAEKGGEIVLKNGKITGNTNVASEAKGGAGVGVWEDGLFTMEGGSITGNSQVSNSGWSDGGGVFVWKNGLFRLLPKITTTHNFGIML
jgi:hypothetical protein